MLQAELNGGNDILSLDPWLPELRLTPDALEVPIPACFLEEAEKVLHLHLPDTRCAAHVFLDASTALSLALM